LPLTLGILLAIAWWFGFSLVDEAPEPQLPLDLERQQTLARWELQVQVVGVNRFVARHGRLPRSLSEVGALTPRPFDYDPRFNFPDYWKYEHLEYARWAWTAWARCASALRLAGLSKYRHDMDASRDCRDRPLMLSPGAPVGQGADWLEHGARLHPKLRLYIEHHGGNPPVSPIPFFVGSVTSHQVSRQLASFGDWRATVRLQDAARWGGAAGLLFAAAFLTLIWRGRPMTRSSWLKVILLPMLLLALCGLVQFCIDVASAPGFEGYPIY